MVHASYRSSTDLYEVRMITTQTKINADVDTVRDVIKDTSIVKYKEAMKESVRQKLAYAVWKNGERVGFVYNRIEGYRYLGCSINILDHIAMILAMKTMFEICDKHKIEFAPHTGNLKYFKSMLLGHSIRGWHQGERDSVVVMREDVESKGLKMFKYLGLEML